MVTERNHPRILIVAENASARFGGEAILPLHIFRGLRRRGVEAWLVVHGRTQDELTSLMPGERDRLHFIPDTRLNRFLFRLERALPARVHLFSADFLNRLVNQWKAQRIVRRLVAEHRIDVVHQPIPVSPRDPSLMYDLGAPVVMGPLNGGMSYPPAFRVRQGLPITAFVRVGRGVTGLINRLIPGKRRASLLLVANDRTRRALPGGLRGEVLTFVENGVDLSLWRPAEDGSGEGGPCRIIYVGRLIGLKAVDLLLEAFREVVDRTPAILRVVGDGSMRRAWEEQARSLGLGDSVEFHGWISQEDCAEMLRRSDVLVLPSLHECGGAVVLEAMASALPVIATNWGGPADYLDESCGILVDPDSGSTFVAGLAEAMVRLATSSDLRRRLGQAGRERVVRDFDWDEKIERFLGFYERVRRRAADVPGVGEDQAPRRRRFARLASWVRPMPWPSLRFSRRRSSPAHLPEWPTDRGLPGPAPPGWDLAEASERSEA